jgi:streptomycin 6-kinase
MAWWDGNGAAKVLARHGEALLLERATGARSLTEMVATGRDDEASRILCEVVLHGDIHHGNVLDGGDRGWLAIDPKGLLGERTFDFVNILRNPDAAAALAPGRFDRQVEVLAAAASVERRRLLDWTLAFAGLSAAWHLAAGTPADLDFAVAALAAA